MLGFAGLANATPYSFDMGAGSWVDTSGTDRALEMGAIINPDLDVLNFLLNEGESFDFLFATLYTDECWINRDDVKPGGVTAYLDFDNPDIWGSVGGMSIGFSAGFHFHQGWFLTGNDPVVVDFGNGGQFTIGLSDTGYGSWWWRGPAGNAPVYVTNLAKAPTELTPNPAPVPEPATVMLVGTGLLCMVVFGHKRSKKNT